MTPATPDRSRASRAWMLGGVLASAALCALYARGGVAWPLGCVALVPWLLALEAARGLRGAFALGVLMAFGFVAAVLPWFGAAVGAFTGLGAGVGVFVWLLCAPLLQPQLVAYALARQLAGRRHGAALRAVAAASAWVACEWVVPKLLGDTFGHGLAPSATLRQAADLGGAAGLTFVLLLVNEALATACTRRSAGWRAALGPLAAGALAVAVLAGYGAWRLAQLRAAPAGDAPSLRVALVQASQVDYERRRREQGAYAVVREALDAHYALSYSAIRDHGAEALLWSETVYPTTFGQPRSADGAALDREIQGFVDTVGVPLVFGTYDRDAAGEYNAAAFVEPGRGLAATYRKTHPFPFTETVPRWLDGPRLRRWLPWTGGWIAGNGARVLPLRAGARTIEVVPLICLDDVHPQLAIDGARLGAQAIVGLSNDAWFTAWPAGARLHLAVATFRSIETRLPQLRVTTNGLSAVIDASGDVLAATRTGDQAVLTAALEARAPPPTLMARWGDWVGRAGATLLLALALLAGWQGFAARARRASQNGPGVAAVDAALLTPGLRVLVGALRVAAGAGLAWLALDMALRTGWQVASLRQLWMFGGAVVAPLVLAWAAGRAAGARVRVESETLVLEQRRRRIDIPLASIAASPAWRLPLPGPGVDLRMASGRRWERSIALRDPATLLRALRDAGAASSPATRGGAAWRSFLHARAQARRPWLDHPLARFVAFPLLPALVAFRLHQVIAFGGTFGEWRTYGSGAWLAGLLVWWAAWSIGLMVVAAALRICIEAGSIAALAAGTRGARVRDALEWCGRALFYLGVPVWLGWRLLGGG